VSASVNNQRRYYLRKAQFFAKFPPEGDGLKATYWAKQEAVVGTALPVGFPHSAKLAAARYTTIEDLDGSDAFELVTEVGLTGAEARHVLDAFGAMGVQHGRL
jgi:hypothetical protein